MLPREIENYEESGLLLIPCKQDKTPAYMGWQQIASSERAKHEEWFEANRFQVGLLTGERNRLVYVDCDERDAAETFFREFRSKIHSIIITPHGVHFPFRHPGERIANAVKAQVGNVLADIRGDGGYVIAGGCTYREGRVAFLPAKSALTDGLVNPGGRCFLQFAEKVGETRRRFKSHEQVSMVGRAASALRKAAKPRNRSTQVRMES